MELTLKQRKSVANGALPKFNLGLSNLSGDMMEKLKIQNMSTNPGGAFNFAGGLEPKLTTSASGLGSLGSGGMASAVEKDPTKFFGLDGASGVAKSGGAGAFLKNNAGGIMNIASTGIDFFSTLGDISKNKMTSDQMMGSGGLTSESANGISYQLSKVDEAGMLNQIDATAKAGTMASMGKGAALGGAIGSVIPGLGTVAGGAIGGVIGGIAGLFGSRKAKREAERQKKIAIDRTIASNTLNREMAYTIGLRNEFNRENRTDTSQSLFHAALGVEDIEKDVDPRKMRTKHKHLVDTAEHGVVLGFGDSFGSEGETMISGKADKNGMHKVHRIRRGPNDTALMNLKKRDTVGSRFFTDYETGLPIADAIYLNALAHGGKISTEDKQRYEMNLNVERMMKESGRRKTNFFPGFLGGTNNYRQLQRFYDGGEDVYRPRGTVGFAPELEPGYTNAAQTTAATGDIAGSTTPGTSSIKTSPFKKIGTGLKNIWGSIKGSGIDGYDVANVALYGSALNAAADINAFTKGGIRVPNSYRENKLGNSAIEDFSRMHSDYYPIRAQQREAEGRGKSSIAQSGGLLAGQKMLGYMGLVNQTQQNMLQALFEHQGRENALRAQEAKAKLELGNQEATRQQQAYQWDEDMLAKAHASLFDAIGRKNEIEYGALQQTIKNAYEKDRFDRTMNLWQSDLKNDAAKTQAIIENLRNNKQNETPEVEKATIAPQTVATMQKLWNRNPNTVDLGELELPEFAITPAKKVAKPKVTKRRTVKRGGKK